MKKLYVVGIGPGEYESMTVKAVNVLKESDIIVGYTLYCDLLKKYFPDKKYISTPMTKELERCKIALDLVKQGKKAALVCSGDPGIYGMASPLLLLSDDRNIDIKIIPGVTALSSGAALLGAPLSVDFSVISLSDYMTDFDLIIRKIRYAALSGMCIVLYNPMSSKRPEHLKIACETIMLYRSIDTVCGVVKNIGREGECMEIMTLLKLKDKKVDMLSTVFIGNGDTLFKCGKMITERGYGHEF